MASFGAWFISGFWRRVVRYPQYRFILTMVGVFDLRSFRPSADGA
jgi:hypothetical protein